jgi:hypothetical protein
VPRIQVVQAIDRLADQLADAATGLALGQQLDQGPQFRRIAVAEHRVNRLAAQPGVHQFVDDLPSGRQPQFEAEAAGHLREKAVQRADPQAMQMLHHRFQKRQAIVATEPLPAGEVAQFGPLLVVARGFGQPQDHPVQDLARRFSGKRRRQNVVTGDAAAEQFQKAVAQLKRLPRPGGSPDQQMRQSGSGSRLVHRGFFPINTTVSQLRRTKEATHEQFQSRK